MRRIPVTAVSLLLTLISWLATPRPAAAACTQITVPVTIGTSGVSCLTADASYSPTTGYTAAILINVPSSSSTQQVVIDLGGYELACTGSNCGLTSGVYANNANDGVVVQNGRITNFDIGVYLYSGNSALVRDLRLYSANPSMTGIYVDSIFNYLVAQRNSFEGNGMSDWNPLR
jgi:hypothetical protein